MFLLFLNVMYITFVIIVLIVDIYDSRLCVRTFHTFAYAAKIGTSLYVK